MQAQGYKQSLVLVCPFNKTIFYMNAKEQIKDYITSQPEPKCSELEALHKLVLKVKPKCKLWFFDGKDEKGKVVSNPNMGYGSYYIKYKDGSTREFYKVGFSANTSGVSFYIMGIRDKKFLANTYGKKLGKASVTGYCIKFKTIKDIDVDVLEEAIRYRFETYVDD